MDLILPPSKLRHFKQMGNELLETVDTCPPHNWDKLMKVFADMDAEAFMFVCYALRHG